MNRLVLTPAYLLACLVLGGSNAAGFLPNLVLQLAALPLIGWSLWQLIQTGPTSQLRSVLILLAMLVAIMAIQLVPLPPAIWTWLPGRASVVEGYRLLDVPLPWLPLSLAPETSLADLLWLLPAIASFLTIAVLGAFRARAIAAVIVGVTLVSVMLGAVQVISRSDGAYFYEITSFGQAVGFFANSNHNATLMLTSIPFLAALQAALLRGDASPRRTSAIRVMAGAAFAVIVVGLVLNSSLAGIGIGVPVTLASWLVFGRQSARFRRPLIVFTAVASLAAVLIIVVGPFGNNLFGHQTANVELSRQTSFAITFKAAMDYFPFGSGLGSFQPVYAQYEPLSTVTPTFMNHAHSDWLELLLETGLPGVLLAGAFLYWGVGRARAILKPDNSDFFAKAAVIAATAILLHSVVDYPLRTAAISAIFAACIALIAGARPYVQRSKKASSARHLEL
jgi:O-antigen ligase